MNTLHFDFTRTAKRQAILEDLLGRLPDEHRSILAERMQAAGVPRMHHHDLGAVDATIDGLMVSDRVKQDMHAIYRILAEAEAAAHGCSVEETHFHEVGNGEAIENVLGICLAIEVLAPDAITATPVQTGSGKVQCAHGLLDIPAPATAAIIARGIPVCSELLEGELCTPTSAAVIYHFVDRFE